MPSHWTYAHFKRDDDLQQGDLVRRDDSLLAVLSKVHSFFCDERYTAFAVLTQSCDLVRRGGQCKAEHIQLAVVRELEPMLPGLLSEPCGIGVPCVFRRESRYDAQQIVQKIVNQNDQARGLFYLHPDADAGIATPSVVMLRVSIALRRMHYDMLRESRCGRLMAEYANKLGWLSGNLYSRIATPDWEDQENDKNASRKLAQAFLASITEAQNENWVPQEWIQGAKDAGVDIAEVQPCEFASRLRKYAPSSPLDIVLRRVEDVSRQVATERAVARIAAAICEAEDIVDSVIQRVAGLGSDLVPADKRQSLCQTLTSDPHLRMAIRNHTASLVKKNLATIDGASIDSLCQGLSDTIGAIKPTMDRLQHHLREFIKNDDETIGRFVAAVRAGHLFPPEAVIMVKQVCTNVMSGVAADDVSTIVKRLRNDRPLQAVLRRASETQDPIMGIKD